MLAEKRPVLPLMLIALFVLAFVSLRYKKTTPEVKHMFSTNPLPHIQEDDPRWDCRTMGNRICGPGH